MEQINNTENQKRERTLCENAMSATVCLASFSLPIVAHSYLEDCKFEFANSVNVNNHKDLAERLVVRSTNEVSDANSITLSEREIMLNQNINSGIIGAATSFFIFGLGVWKMKIAYADTAVNENPKESSLLKRTFSFIDKYCGPSIAGVAGGISCNILSDSLGFIAPTLSSVTIPIDSIATNCLCTIMGGLFGIGVFSFSCVLISLIKSIGSDQIPKAYD